MLTKLKLPTLVPQRHSVMLLSRSQSAHWANISFWLLPCKTLDSLPVQLKYLPDLHKGSSKIQPCSSNLSFCITNSFCGIYAYNITQHLSLPCTETVTVLRSLNTCNKNHDGLPRWFSGKESTCQHMRCMLSPWAGKIPWRRKWQPTPVFLPGKSHGQRSLVARVQGSQRVEHDWTCTYKWTIITWWITKYRACD